MAGLPNVEQDISLLRRFIQGISDLPTHPGPELEAAESRAEALLHKLETPIRIALSGLSGSGKSSLVNLLLGEPLSPIDADLQLPAIVFHHADEPITTAGWWDRPSEVFPGHDVNGVLKMEPDLISIGVDSPILKSLEIVDVSGLDQPGRDKEAVLSLTQLTDVLVWCSRADNPLTEDELRLVKLLPNRLTKNGLLVLTHADTVPADTLEDIAVGLEKRPDNGFLYVEMISTPQAWAAFQGEGADPATAWEESGAPDTLASLTEVARQARAKEVVKVQRNIAKQVIPFLMQVPMPPEEEAVEDAPEEMPADEAEVVPVAEADGIEVSAPIEEAPENTAPAEELGDPQEELTGTAILLDEWLGRMAELYEKIEDDEIDEADDFVQAAQELVSDYLDDLADSDELPDELEWLIADYEKANDLMVLLQFESDERTASDAARILAQLTDTLCHI